VTRTVVIHQPDFLPYLGFFHRFLQADVFVVLDHVQFVRNSSSAWTHRDKIKTPKGETWLSLSVKKSPLETAIKDIELSPGASWRDQNLNLIAENYRAAPFRGSIFGEVERLYRLPVNQLAAFNLLFLDLVCGWLGIRIERVHSSALRPAGQKSEMIADLVKSLGGTHYLSGAGARAYHDQVPFDRRGIEVVWQDFRHPVYPQQFGAFIPSLSTIDALFNCGPERTAQMLRSA